MEAILNLQRTVLTVVDTTTVYISMHITPIRDKEITLNVYEGGFKPCTNPTKVFNLALDNLLLLKEATRKLTDYLEDENFKRKDKKYGTE
jgi:hypothetical protein